MANTTSCPPVQELSHFLTGQLGGPEAEGIAQHLGGCAQCLDTAQSLKLNDTLVDAVRKQATYKDPADKEEIDKLIGHLKSLPSSAASGSEDQARVFFSCGCGKKLSTKKSLAGKQVKCPGCGQRVLVPAVVNDSATAPPPQSTVTGTTPAPAKEATGPESVNPESTLVNFLAPAQASDELGRLGKYRILKVLGHGGMGVVYKAEDCKLKRTVALKAMLPAVAAGASAAQRFLREAQAMAALEHDHIVRIYQVDEDRGVPFLAMEFLKGEPLDQRLAREPVLPVPEVLRLGREIAEALAAAHDTGLIHRDIKPGNIWLETRGEGRASKSETSGPGKEGASPVVFRSSSLAPRAKILDFGLARSAVDNVQLTQSGAIVGTPAYMAPEQAEGLPVDHRCDLFSLGCVLYRMATGVLPFKGDNTISVLRALALQDPPPPIEVNGAVPADLSDFIMKLLAKKPEGRPRSAQEVAAALGALERGEAIRPVGPGRSKVASLRHPQNQWVWPAATALLFLGAGGAYLFYQIVIIRDKNGDEVARLKVPEGGSIHIEAEKSRKPDEVAKVARAISAPTQIPEPPPLAEWLKGRKLLTVSQDGKGQFATIKAALDAVKPHQVIKVLDRGPYRELLRVGTLPEDIGLISEQQTVLELLPTTEAPGGHTVGPVYGFRLSGLRLLSPPLNNDGGIFYWTLALGLVVEDCYFGWTKPALIPGHAMTMVFTENEPTPPTVFLRRCLFDSANVNFGKSTGRVPVLVTEQCYFKNALLAGNGPSFQKVAIRHNVFDFPGSTVWIRGLKEVQEIFEISNNTAVLANNVSIMSLVQAAPRQGVIVRNNISEAALNLDREAEKVRPDAINNWQVDHNCYMRRGPLPKAPTDVIAEPDYLSLDPNHPDYLHLSADSPLARAGPGGAWPSYIGAFPPGPAPKDGDWFSRLRQRWGNVAPVAKPLTAPTQIPEPPPLAEWLKGRKLLTVSQDGKGQFTTIKAALDALKPHQVIKVLDRGPYRELLRIGTLPEDTGLISEQSTVLELPPLPENQGGHTLGPVDGFRLSGMCILSPPLNNNNGMIYWTQAVGLVLEDCYFGWTRPDGGKGSAMGLLFKDSEPNPQPVFLRNCFFNAAGVVFRAPASRVPILVIEQCYFKNALLNGNGPTFQTVLIRHNVFDFPRSPIWIMDLKEVQAIFEISNNIAVATTIHPIVSLVLAAPGQGIIVRNNISASALGLDGEAQKVREAAIKNWQVDHNCYQRRGQLPRAPTDVIAEPEYLSLDPSHPDYLHLPEESPLGKAGPGGAWPSYLGAFPPGPTPKDGDWFSRLRQRWGNVAPVAKPLAAPTQIPEPPPLAEWLKGRKLLTVSQDGKGQFATIKAALDEIKPHQVVKVLDRGPYRELLRYAGLPDDIGLISEQQTVLVLPPVPGDQVGLMFGPLDGFRLSGFRVLSPPLSMNNPLIHWTQAVGLVVEDCYFGWTKPDASNGFAMALVFKENEENPKAIFLRRCLFDSASVNFAKSTARAPVLVIEQCYFKNALLAGHGPSIQKVVIRHNVFDLPGSTIWFWDIKEVQEIFEISNNTAVVANVSLLSLVHAAPRQGIIVRNNISESALNLEGEAEKLRADAINNWQVDHNCYMRRGPLPKAPTDVVVEPQYLSLDPHHANYLHLPAESPLARAGAGGPWPSYMGAFPPGPAPKDGDWFSRLRLRWGNVAPVAKPLTAPTQIPEPPPLAEWLKGRKLLTVSQDGKGQFATIKAALDAVKPHQVIKVLDRGPYRELLRYGGLPDDIGLISEQQTVLELLPSKDVQPGHKFGPVDGFRLSGFRVMSPPLKQYDRIINWSQVFELVIEDCYFGWTKPEKPINRGAMSLWFKDAEANPKPTFLRRCLFDAAGVDFSAPTSHVPVLVIEQCYFKNALLNGNGPSFQKVVIRHNVFVFAMSSIWIQTLKEVQEIFEISNNTAVANINHFMSLVVTAPPQGIVVRNNISDWALGLDREKGLADAIKNWQVDHNCYLRRGSLPKAPTDVVVEPQYLSLDPHHANYLHLPAESPLARAGAGGPWPSYMGAFPPGPPPKDGDWFSRLRLRWR